MEAVNSIKDLYLEFIRDIYHAEVLLMPELRFFEEKAKKRPLKQALNHHRTNTRAHTLRLEDIQESLDSDLLHEHCRTMKSMIVETKELVDRCKDDKVAERAMVGSLHRITRCMITVYEMLVSMADELELPNHKKALEENLKNEVRFDKTISAFGFNMLFQEFNLQKKLS
ncbi:MAG: DUF892 family protein [Balneolaceae bacterium]|jgi:ferritin-like metal-binding protein YciE